MFAVSLSIPDESLMALTRDDVDLLNAEAASIIASMLGAQAELVKNDPTTRGRPRYAQLPPTSRSVPSTVVTPDNLTSRIPDRTQGWPQAIAAGAVVPAQLRGAFEVWEYQAPSRRGREVIYAPGWFVVGFASDGVTVYQRMFNGEGPGDQSTAAWRPGPRA